MAASNEQHDRDINQLITNINEIDVIHGSWACDKSANFVVGDLDHYSAYFVTTTTAATILGTLPSCANNKYRTITYCKTDATTGVVQMSGSAISIMGASVTSLYLINKGDELTVQSDGSEWVVKSGPVQPVPSEPSLGTPHPVADGNKTNVLVVSSAVNTADVWSAAVTLTKAPAGAKMGYCNFYFTLAGTMTRLGVARASGETLYNISGNPPWLNMILGRNQSNGSVCEGMGWIPIDSNKQFKWCCADSNVTVRISDATYYWC